MKNTRLDAFRDVILSRIAALEQNSEATSEARAAVTLDQQSVGRLSRMDAMQQQSLNNATEKRRQSEIAQLRAALTRIEEGEFGYCDHCGDDIPPKRLELLPTTLLCVSCASG